MNMHQKITIKQPLSIKQLQVRRFLKASQAQQGVTLIELMVALVIGLVVSLAVYSVLNASEGRKRSTTSVNDIDQAGTYAAYQLDKALRSAGSGFTGGLNPNAASTTNAASYYFACKLSATKNGAALLPMTTAFSVPFTNVPQTVTLAPLVILDGAATDGTTSHGDVLISMGGSGGLSESITNLTGQPTTSALKVSTAASITASDIVLLMSATSGSAANPGSTCLIDQVKSDFVQGTGSTYDVSLAGDYHGTGGTISGYGITSVAVNLGKSPVFNMYGVGANNVLYKYDLLQPAVANTATATAPNPSEFVDGVYQMEAIYGITNLTGAAGNFTWQLPTGTYASSALLAGTPAANSLLQTITMVRVALVMRTALYEKNAISASEVTLFVGTGLEQKISGLDTHYRYRVIETTIPLRNTLTALAG